MKITVQLADSQVKQVCRLTGERKKGPAIRKLVTDALTMQRRRDIAAKFLSGRWGVELGGFEAGRAADREAADGRVRRWRK